MKKRSWLQMSYTMPYWDSDPSWFDSGTTGDGDEEEDYQPPPVSLSIPGLLAGPSAHRLTPPNNNNTGEGDPEPRYRDTAPPRAGVSSHSGSRAGISPHRHSGRSSHSGSGIGRSSHSGSGIPLSYSGGSVTEGRLPLHPLTSPETYPHSVPRHSGPSPHFNSGDSSLRGPYQLK